MMRPGAVIIDMAAESGADYFGVLLDVGYSPRTVTLEKAKPLSTKELLLRGVLSALLILAITLTAPLAGSRWAGILSSFPSTLFALLLIIHYETGTDLFPLIIRSFAYSVPTLVLFYLGCLLALPAFGLNMGFVLVYAVSAVYLYMTHRLMQYFKRRG